MSRTVFALVAIAVLTLALWTAINRNNAPLEQEEWVIGLISNNPNGLRNIEGVKAGLQKMGYGETTGVKFLFAGAPTLRNALEQAISQMVSDGADLIFTAGTPTGIAAYNATRGSGVPVVFGVIADPVAAGVMTDLTRPGGTMTGVMLSQNQARRLEILHSIVPDARKILLPYNPNDPAPVSAAKQLAKAAAELGLILVHAHAREDAEVGPLLAAIPHDIGAIFMLPDSTVNRRVDDVVRAATERGLPVSGPSTAQVEAGATMAYGIVHHEVGVQAARIIVQILRGADPAETPVETADYYLTLNVAAADRIALELPEQVLQQADVIIRIDQFNE